MDGGGTKASDTLWHFKNTAVGLYRGLLLIVELKKKRKSKFKKNIYSVKPHTENKRTHETILYLSVDTHVLI